MNTLLLTADDFSSDNCAIIRDARRCEHIYSVHGAKAGDQLKVGMLNGKLGSALVQSIDPTQIILSDIKLEKQPPTALPLTLLLGLPRPKMLKRILQTVATLGVKKIILINSYRVEKSYWQTPWLTPEAIHAQLILGLEQGCDTVLPEVTLAKRFKPFVEDDLPSLIVHSRALVAHPYTAQVCPTHTKEPITLAIGPEGGFIPYEINMLETCGFEAVHLGERIMRVETTVPFLLGRLYS
jgi:RsmE family RNA methyltransferase